MARGAIPRASHSSIVNAIETEALARYLRNGFRTVQGWCGGPFSFLVTELLAEAQPAACRGLGAAEIGVHHGLFFIGLHNLCGPHARSLALDLFDLQHLNVDFSGSGSREIFLSNVQAHAQSPENCTAYPGIDSLSIDDAEASRLAAEFGPFRFFSVDGGHTAEHCHHDLRTSQAMLAEGGIAILDDSFGFDWPGVTEGLIRYLGDGSARLTPFAITPKKTFLAGPAFCGAYRQTLIDGLRNRNVPVKTKPGELCGSEVLILSN